METDREENQINIIRATYLGAILGAAALTLSMVANATVNTVGQLTCASNVVNGV